MDSLLELRKFLAPEIVHGMGSLALAGRYAENFGAKKVLVVTDPGIQEAGWVKEVEENLAESDISYVTFNGVTPNPKDYEVMAGAEVYRKEGCDLIIAVGGGSPMDCAKGIGVVVGNGLHINKFEGVDEVTYPGPPFIFIPTTAGTGADVSQFSIITDTSRGVKIAIISKMVVPDIALVDPQTTASMTPELTAATGMDTLCHGFEAYVSNAASPLTDMAALRAIELVRDNLVGAYCHPSNMTYRNNMMMASLMAGLAFSNASLGLVHAMAHSLGGAKGLAHGECNAILLEHVVRFNYTSASEKYDCIAGMIGLNLDTGNTAGNAAMLSDWIAALRRRLSISIRLSDTGIALSDLPLLADFATKDPCIATNPRVASPSEIEEILKHVY